jgi:hypothetical protein
MFWKANGVFNNIQISGTLNPGRHKVCITYDPTKIRLFVDGVLEIEELGTDWTNNLPTNLTDINIGNSPTSNTGRWGGSIYKTLVSKTSILQAQAEALTTL